MITQATIVLAAGKGTRMKSRIPKVLHRVCGQEMVALAVKRARQVGDPDVVVVIPPDSEGIRTLLADSVHYVVQDQARGSGHALLAAKDVASQYEQITVLYADVPLLRSETVEALKRTHMHQNAAVTVLTFKPEEIRGLGRVVRDDDGNMVRIVEEAEVDNATKAADEANTGVYCFNGTWLWENLEAVKPSSNGEFYLTDLIGIASDQGEVVADLLLEDPTEALGVNDRTQLARAEAILRHRICEKWMLAGVTITDPLTTYIDLEAKIGQDTIILPNTHIQGDSVIGENCEIGPNSMIYNGVVGEGCLITSSVVRDAKLSDRVSVGPYSHVRPGSVLSSKVRLGNYAEVKNSRIGSFTRIGHFSYLGDADVGSNVNIGAGTITCNFDGENKHETEIGDGALIGSGTMLVAPVTVGAGAKTGAGSVVTKNVSPNTLVIGSPAREKT